MNKFYIFLSLICVVFASCSSLGGDGSGDANLPNRGVAAYTPVDLGEEQGAQVLAPPDGARLESPAAVVADDGRTVALFVTLRPTAAGARASILRASSDDGGITFGAPQPALEAPAVPWARGSVSAPAVIRADGIWRMVFASDDPPAIGFATSRDGLTFEALDAPLLLPEEPWEAGGVEAPSLVLDGGRFALYYTARDREGRPSIARALLGTEGELRRTGVVLAPGTGCADPDGAEARCWDSDGVEAPEVRLATNGAGRAIYRMFYLGRAGRAVDLGFAASRDGQTWSRFPFNPTLEGAGEATNALQGGRYLLYWANRGGVDLSVNDRGSPSEIF